MANAGHEIDILLIFGFIIIYLGSESNPDAKRLYDDLLSNYNKLVRPVANVSDALEVKIKLKLSQLIDVVIKKYLINILHLISMTRNIHYMLRK